VLGITLITIIIVLGIIHVIIGGIIEITTHIITIIIEKDREIEIPSMVIEREYPLITELLFINLNL
jgi:hypothetical protein